MAFVIDNNNILYTYVCAKCKCHLMMDERGLSAHCQWKRKHGDGKAKISIKFE